MKVIFRYDGEIREGILIRKMDNFINVRCEDNKRDYKLKPWHVIEYKEILNGI